MSKGRGGAMMGVGGPRNPLPRTRLRGGAADTPAARGGQDPAAQKRALLAKLRERRNG
ncbi:DUF6243 family protein [Streptomyces sp. NPDC059853]|uniref:DUF6243 family protein n=1 Tax=Streptomyces sp. NPDC059853 TaxID=3346973 RepID=UPI00364AE971